MSLASTVHYGSQAGLSQLPQPRSAGFTNQPPLPAALAYEKDYCCSGSTNLVEARKPNHRAQHPRKNSLEWKPDFPERMAVNVSFVCSRCSNVNCCDHSTKAFMCLATRNMAVSNRTRNAQEMCCREPGLATKPDLCQRLPVPEARQQIDDEPNPRQNRPVFASFFALKCPVGPLSGHRTGALSKVGWEEMLAECHCLSCLGYKQTTRILDASCCRAMRGSKASKGWTSFQTLGMRCDECWLLGSKP